MHSVVILQSNWKWNRVRKTKKKREKFFWHQHSTHCVLNIYLAWGTNAFIVGSGKAGVTLVVPFFVFFNCCLTGTHCTVQAASFVCLLTSYDKIPISCFAVGVNVPLFLLYSFFFPFNLFFFLLSFLVYIDSSSNELKILLSWIAPPMYWELTLKFDSSPRHKVSIV